MLLELMGVSCAYSSTPVLQDITYSIKQGDILGIVGPNGSGKSTLLRTMSRVMPPAGGKVMLQEKDMYKIPARQTARQMAFVSQETGVEFPFTVEETVLMGRIPHLKRFQKEGTRDWEIVSLAMDLTETSHLADRLITEISGGERQRVLIARALAQEPRILFLDEPTSFLDLNYQIGIMELLNRLRRSQGLTVVMVVHDLNLASNFCDSILVLKQGLIYAAGPPDRVISAQLIKDVYGCRVQVDYGHPGDRPVVLIKPSNTRTGNKNGSTVHVVGGGGSAAGLFHYLLDGGWKVTAGVINMGDTDWLEAQHLGIEIVEAAPFSEINKEQKMRNREFMNRADYILLPEIPFGSGNIRNLEAVLEEAREGACLIIIEREDIERRDYTGGLAAGLYKQLMKTGACVARDAGEALGIMENGNDHAKER